MKHLFSLSLALLVKLQISLHSEFHAIILRLEGFLLHKAVAELQKTQHFLGSPRLLQKLLFE